MLHRFIQDYELSKMKKVGFGGKCKYDSYNINVFLISKKWSINVYFILLMLTSPHHFNEREVWTHTYSLIPPLFIEVPVPSQKSEQFCICVLRVSLLPLSIVAIILFHFDTFIEM